MCDEQTDTAGAPIIAKGTREAEAIITVVTRTSTGEHFGIVRSDNDTQVAVMVGCVSAPTATAVQALLRSNVLSRAMTVRKDSQGHVFVTELSYATGILEHYSAAVNEGEDAVADVEAIGLALQYAHEKFGWPAECMRNATLVGTDIEKHLGPKQEN